MFYGKPMVPQFVFDAFTWIVLGGLGSVAAEKFSLSRERDYGRNRWNSHSDRYRSLDEFDEPVNGEPIIGEEDPDV